MLELKFLCQNFRFWGGGVGKSPFLCGQVLLFCPHPPKKKVPKGNRTGCTRAEKRNTVIQTGSPLTPARLLSLVYGIKHLTSD